MQFWLWPIWKILVFTAFDCTPGKIHLLWREHAFLSKNKNKFAISPPKSRIQKQAFHFLRPSETFYFNYDYSHLKYMSFVHLLVVLKKTPPVGWARMFWKKISLPLFYAKQNFKLSFHFFHTSETYLSNLFPNILKNLFLRIFWLYQEKKYLLWRKHAILRKFNFLFLHKTLFKTLAVHFFVLPWLIFQKHLWPT